MDQTNRSGDVQLTYSNGQLHVVVVGSPQYSLPARTSITATWKRTLAAVFVSACLLVMPAVSRAATYTSTDIIAATNAVRTQRGLATLTTNATLTAAAAAKANDMFTKQYFNHYSPSGEAPWAFFKRSGYAYTAAGENLAIDFVDGADILPAWMGSPSHRDNILNAKYRDVGIAVVDGTMNGSPTTVVVQFFGSSQAAVSGVPTPPKPAIASPDKPQPTPIPARTVTAEPIPTIPAIQQSVTKLATEPQSTTAPVPLSEPLAEIRGVATRVTPAVTWTTSSLPEFDPRIAILVLSTFAAYVLLLTGAATLQKAVSDRKAVANLALKKT